MTAMKTIRRLSLGLVLCAIAGSGVELAVAKATRLASWEFSRVWPTAVRFLRVDEGFSIIEKDAESGYVLFEVERGDKIYRGSLELVKTRDYAERKAVRLILKITDLPIYKEDGVLERLLDKLREELGQPVDPPEARPEPAPEPEPEPDKKKKKKGDTA
jgi:hypothetical protein